MIAFTLEDIYGNSILVVLYVNDSFLWLCVKMVGPYSAQQTVQLANY